jgi:hypothetical protein
MIDNAGDRNAFDGAFEPDTATDQTGIGRGGGCSVGAPNPQMGHR